MAGPASINVQPPDNFVEHEPGAHALAYTESFTSGAVTWNVNQTVLNSVGMRIVLLAISLPDHPLLFEWSDLEKKITKGASAYFASGKQPLEAMGRYCRLLMLPLPCCRRRRACG